jgi:hypothetical protein
VSDDVTREVLAAEQRRCAAIAAEDRTRFSPTTSCTHTQSGRPRTSTRRRAVEHDGLSVRSFGDVALLSGSSVYRYAEPLRGDSHYGAILDVLQVWVRRSAGWQMVAQHGVKIASRNASDSKP